MEPKRRTKRTRAPRLTPPECLCCSGKTPWVALVVPQESEFRGQSHEIRTEVLQCRHCDAITMTPAQVDSNLQRLQDTHSTWISKTIKSTKRYLGLSHRRFATAVNIGPATLSRAISTESLIDASTEEFLLIKIQKLKQTHEINTFVTLSFPWKESLTPDNAPWTPSGTAMESNDRLVMA